MGRLALGAHGLVVLRAQVAQATGKLLRLGAGCGGGCLVLLDMRAGVCRALGRSVALTRDLALLVCRALALRVQAAHLGRN